MTEALTGLLAMMLLSLVRIPIALSMGIVGIVGYAYMRDWNWAPAFATVQTKIYETGRNYTLSVVPLFILMGNFVTRAGLSRELFRCAYAFIGHLRGGLAMATILACAGFGAICGSSIATAATMAKVAYPSMKKFGYSDSLATGAIASGGTLGILIPPSTIMVIYGVFTETNIGKLFAAGVLPGILAATLLCIAVGWVTWRDPKAGPPGERSSWKERWAAFRGIWMVAALFFFVMGGIYGGFFTATEGAGMGAFGAICGSSIATAATMAKVAYPSMKKFGYSDSLATGAIASGGTLGILIPPSTIMVIYGVFTETNIGKLFAAGVLPGILAATLLCIAVGYVTWRDPKAGPPGERSSWAERWKAFRGIWMVAALFFFVMGGIYGGFFTATEGAGMGAFGAMVIALWRRELSWTGLYHALVESARTTSMLFLILIGALMFAEFVNITTMPNDLKDFVNRFEISPIAVVAAICIIYVLLGTAMEELSMILLTLPVFFPLVVHLGFDPVWFGVLTVVVVEIGLISPPVGMNLFVLKTLIPQVSTGTVFRGVMPFIVADCVRLAILIAFPVISLWLPGMMK